MQISYVAPPKQREFISRLGRTEDVRLSPANRRLAVAAFEKNRIAVFDIDMTASAGGTRIAISNGFEISSGDLNNPHGIDFLDENTIVVADRGGDVCIFKVPTASNGGSVRLDPVTCLDSGVISTPGAVCISKTTKGDYTVLVCNNYANYVTRHALTFSSDSGSVGSQEILLRKWLDTPDGICITAQMDCIAVSNHDAHCVFLYQELSSLNEDSDCAARTIHMA